MATAGRRLQPKSDSRSPAGANGGGTISAQLSLFPPKSYLTVQDVAELLDVPKSFVYRRTSRGHSDALPSYRFGGHLRFRPDDVHSWIEKHRRDPHPPDPLALVAAAKSRRPRSTGRAQRPGDG